MKHTALSLISVILKRALKTVDHCLNKETWQGSGVYSAAVMEDFVRLFREALSKVGTAAAVAIPNEVLEPSLWLSQASTAGEEAIPGAQRPGVKRSAMEGFGCSWDLQPPQELLVVPSPAIAHTGLWPA